MFVLAGQIIPLDFFPNYYINFINYTPIPYLIKFPVDTAMAINFSYYNWIFSFLIGLSWCFIMKFFSVIIYKIGIKRYEAYGS